MSQKPLCLSANKTVQTGSQDIANNRLPPSEHVTHESLHRDLCQSHINHSRDYGETGTSADGRNPHYLNWIWMGRLKSVSPFLWHYTGLSKYLDHEVNNVVCSLMGLLGLAQICRHCLDHPLSCTRSNNSCFMSDSCPDRLLRSAGGVYSGEVAVWDSKQTRDPLLAQTEMTADWHREPVFYVKQKWFRLRNCPFSSFYNLSWTTNHHCRSILWTRYSLLLFSSWSEASSPFVTPAGSTGAARGHGEEVTVLLQRATHTLCCPQNPFQSLFSLPVQQEATCLTLVARYLKKASSTSCLFVVTTGARLAATFWLCQRLHDWTGHNSIPDSGFISGLTFRSCSSRVICLPGLKGFDRWLLFKVFYR